MITLYPDQLDLVTKVREQFRTNQIVLLQSPTGSGKSRMGSYVVANALAKGNTCLFDVPMKELRKQITNTFTELNIEHSFIASGQKYNPFDYCWVSTTQTIAGRLDKAPRIKFAVIDEAHQGGAARERLIDWLVGQGSKILLLSATPERLDAKPIRADVMVEGQPIEWLIKNKRLSDYEFYSCNPPDLSSLHVAANGEYNQSEAAALMESQTVLIGDAVRQYQKHAMGKRNIAYCASIKHSKMTCEAFNAAGISAAHIDGSMGDDERIAIIRRYASREILVLCNADLLLYGFDLAAASGDKNAVVEAISDLKPTMSKAMQFQKIGRALRYKDYPAIILDHAGNAFNPDGSAKHGLPSWPVEWNWQGRQKRKGTATEKTIPVRQCPTCFFVHRPAPACVACGYVYEIKSRVLEVEDGELLQVDKDAIKAVVRAERQVQGRARTLGELKELERRKGYSKGWAEKVYKARMLPHRRKWNH